MNLQLQCPTCFSLHYGDPLECVCLLYIMYKMTLMSPYRLTYVGISCELCSHAAAPKWQCSMDNEEWKHWKITVKMIINICRLIAMSWIEWKQPIYISIFMVKWINGLYVLLLVLLMLLLRCNDVCQNRAACVVYAFHFKLTIKDENFIV